MLNKIAIILMLLAAVCYSVAVVAQTQTGYCDTDMECDNGFPDPSAECHVQSSDEYLHLECTGEVFGPTGGDWLVIAHCKADGWDQEGSPDVDACKLTK